MADELHRELARLTFITETVRDLLPDWWEEAARLGTSGRPVAGCARQVEDVLSAAGDAEYTLRPLAMLALHLRAAADLAAGLCDEEASRTFAPAELTALVHAAGELWNAYGDRDDVLSAFQRNLAGRAAQLVAGGGSSG